MELQISSNRKWQARAQAKGSLPTTCKCGLDLVSYSWADAFANCTSHYGHMSVRASPLFSACHESKAMSGHVHA